MGLFDSISNGIKNHFDKNREQREMMEELQRNADAQKVLAFRDAFAENAKIVAISEAKKDAAELSGLQKLRATNRARNLSTQEHEPGTFFDRLSNFTKKNKARMRENLERTKELRAVADQEKNKAFVKRTQERNSRIGTSKVFGSSKWKM